MHDIGSFPVSLLWCVLLTRQDRLIMDSSWWKNFGIGWPPDQSCSVQTTTNSRFTITKETAVSYESIYIFLNVRTYAAECSQCSVVNTGSCVTSDPYVKHLCRHFTLLLLLTHWAGLFSMQSLHHHNHMSHAFIVVWREKHTGNMLQRIMSANKYFIIQFFYMNECNAMHASNKIRINSVWVLMSSGVNTRCVQLKNSAKENKPGLTWLLGVVKYILTHTGSQQQNNIIGKLPLCANSTPVQR